MSVVAFLVHRAQVRPLQPQVRPIADRHDMINHRGQPDATATALALVALAERMIGEEAMPQLVPRAVVPPLCRRRSAGVEPCLALPFGVLPVRRHRVTPNSDRPQIDAAPSILSPLYCAENYGCVVPFA